MKTSTISLYRANATHHNAYIDLKKFKSIGPLSGDDLETSEVNYCLQHSKLV